MKRWKSLWLLLILMGLSWPQTVGATPLSQLWDHTSLANEGIDLCGKDNTLRRPDWCPDFIPASRKARAEFLRAQLPDPLPQLNVEELEATDNRVTDYTFAYVANLPAATYTHPLEAEVGLEPRRQFLAGDNWVSVIGKTDYNGETWYEINPGEYIQASHLRFASPSHFSGVKLQEQPAYPFGWINRQTQTAALPGGKPDGAVVKRYQMFSLYAQDTVGSSVWYMIGQDQWVEQSFVSRVDVNPRPEGVSPQEKWIDINTFEQTLAAYEGDRMVFATLVSTGRHGTWTPNGLNRIWAKLPATPMSNQDVGPDSPAWYYLEDVEWTQYFSGAYALHTAYWHDAFSFTRSHGCVNLAPLDARWLFDFTSPLTPQDARMVMSNEASPGTWVWVHMTPPIAALALGQ
ncbi:MAG: L,D-transpeptidase [Anaerolineae bacterium]|nr:L,D-transpeptidase [Anaerolineae bacterium]